MATSLDREFSAIAHRLVVRARRAHPELATRLAGAERIVTELELPVVLYTDGTATVRSKSAPDQVYQVNGCACSCPDHQQRGRVCCHALAAGLWRRTQREYRDEQQRRRDYGAQYVAPGTPAAFAPCRACGVQAVLSDRGLCAEDEGEPRFYVTALGERALAGSVA